ncbi:MAG: hypothetical protein J5771_00580 [Bacteroidales bacterium]|nr:hypothetical protein [Bacteroidales bacterium]
MKFDEITQDGRLWAARYDGMQDNILFCTFNNWLDLDWLLDFFTEHSADLLKYFNIIDLDKAIFDTFSDAIRLQSVILDLSPEADLDALFKPLDNNRTAEMLLGKEKAKGFKMSGHPSWLRLYALKLEPQSYVITGGAIKLTHTMNERQHTIEELQKMERVRNFLIENGVVDLEGIKDYNNEINGKGN